jgi:hypothetical protein
MSKNIETVVRNLHLQITLRINDENYNWQDPAVNTSFEFSVPVELLDTKQIAGLIDLHARALNAQFPAEKERWEAEQKAKKAEQAKVEQGASV